MRLHGLFFMILNNTKISNILFDFQAPQMSLVINFHDMIFAYEFDANDRSMYPLIIFNFMNKV